MARLTLDELKTKYNEKITDNDLVIELFEDLTDSIDVSDEIERLKEEIDKKEIELKELKEKYKARFLESVKEDVKEEPDEDVKEVIDVKEI